MNQPELNPKLDLLIWRYFFHSNIKVTPEILNPYLILAFAIVLNRVEIQLLANRYLILIKLASGGFGKTYVALDNLMPSPLICVIKQLNPPRFDEPTIRISRKFFEIEAKTLQQLGTHDQIPQLLAYFEQEEQFYLVQEYINGIPLSEELLSGKQLNEKETIKILQDVLEVLVTVHQEGVIHRDIKPANLIRRYLDNKIVLIDFGAVKQTSTQMVNSQGQTVQTVIIGTPEYMSSEQSQGYPKYASDIYSLGLVAIQALTGKSPFNLERDSYHEFI